ncbi:MAG TPA: thioesterase [Bacteroidetes bacterium]|nr:thioesterase [Bacteroidota bacterium]
MARVKLEIPRELSFSCLLQVRITDLNYANHLANDKVLSLFHEARFQYFVHFGYTELKVEGKSLIMADVVINFRNESFYGEQLFCEVGAGDFSRAGFDLYYRLIRKSDKAIIAEAKTGMVFYDYSTRKVISIPAGFKEKVGEAEIVHSVTKTKEQV